MSADPTIGDLLDALGDGRVSGPAGHSAAIAAALAASLVTRTARRAAQWPEAPGTVAQAEALRRRLLSLARRDHDAHQRASMLLGRAGVPEPADGHAAPGDRDRELAAALHRAATVPLAIAEAAADVAVIAASGARHGPPHCRADAQAAADLAHGAAVAAARLVRVNLAVSPGHELARRAQTAVETADDARREAEQAG